MLGQFCFNLRGLLAYSNYYIFADAGYIRVSVAGSESNAESYNAAAQWPVIKSVTGASDMPTEGGNIIAIRGKSLGPVNAVFANTPGSTTYVRYGPVTGLEFSAKNCTVTRAQLAIECETAPGFGNSLYWRVSLSGRVSEPLLVETSGYWAPQVAAVSHSLLPTTGKPPVGEIITLNGTNFGPTFDEYPPQVMLSGAYGTLDGISCTITIPHTQIQCISMEPGVGTEYHWFVSIGSQISEKLAEASLDFMTPSIESIRGPVSGFGMEFI